MNWVSHCYKQQIRDFPFHFSQLFFSKSKQNRKGKHRERERERDLVEIDLGDLVRDASPVSLGHVVSESPVGQKLSHLEQVLLLFSFGFFRGRGRRWSSSSRVIRWSSTEASKEIERELQEALASIARSSVCQSCRHFWVSLCSLSLSIPQNLSLERLRSERVWGFTLFWNNLVSLRYW